MDSLGGGGLPFAFGMRHPGLGEGPFAALPSPGVSRRLSRPPYCLKNQLLP